MTMITKQKFFGLFDLQEKAAYLMAVKAARDAANPTIAEITMVVVDEEFKMNPIIDLTNPDVVTGVNILEQAGIIQPGRAAELLAYKRPEMPLIDGTPFVKSGEIYRDPE